MCVRVGVGGSRAPPGYLRPVCSEVCACGLVFFKGGAWVGLRRMSRHHIKPTAPLEHPIRPIELDKCYHKEKQN